jgi:large subunit ribosomal protein L25
MSTTTRPALAAAHRDITGKKVAALRRAGRLPAVVYGHGVPSANLSIDTHEFELLRRHVGANALIDLSIDGKKPQPVLVHGVAIHPVDRKPLHVDLLAVRMTQELMVDVPLVATGEAEAVSRHGGTLIHPTETVRVKALPDRLPQAIEYDISSLVDFDASIYVSELSIPEDVTLLTDAGEIVAKVLAPRIEEVPVVEVPEGEAAEEAAEAAGEAAPAEGEPESTTGPGGESEG